PLPFGCGQRTPRRDPGLHLRESAPQVTGEAAEKAALVDREGTQRCIARCYCTRRGGGEVGYTLLWVFPAPHEGEAIEEPAPLPWVRRAVKEGQGSSEAGGGGEPGIRPCGTLTALDEPLHRPRVARLLEVVRHRVRVAMRGRRQYLPD